MISAKNIISAKMVLHKIIKKHLNASPSLPAKAMLPRNTIWAIATVTATAFTRVTKKQPNGLKKQPRRVTLPRNTSWAFVTVMARVCLKVRKKPSNGLKKRPSKVTPKQPKPWRAYVRRCKMQRRLF